MKGKKGTITLTLDTKQLMDLGLTQSSVYLARFAGDKVSEENEIPVSAILLPDFSGMTEQDKALAPAIRLSESKIDLSRVLVKKTKPDMTLLSLTQVSLLCRSVNCKYSILR